VKTKLLALRIETDRSQLKSMARPSGFEKSAKINDRVSAQERHRPPRHEASEYSTAVRTPFKYSTSNTDSVTDVDRSIQTEYGTTIYKAPEAGGLLLFSDKVAQKGRFSKKLYENPVP
jgi:hypothetical protein